MTTETPSPPAPAPPADRPVVAGLWLVALVLGLMVAVIGVNTAIDSVHRKQYSEARAGAVYLIIHGYAINSSMQRLNEVDVRDYNLLKDGQSALEAGDTSLFNRNLAQAEIFSVEQRSLQDKVQNYKAEFDKALKR